MNKKLKIGLWGIALLINTFIFEVFIESVSANKLLFVSKFLNVSFEEKILDYSTPILIVLVGLSIGFYLMSHKDSIKNNKRKKFSSLCSTIFEEILKKNNKIDQDQISQFKVSILEVKKGIFLNKKLNFVPKIENYLKVNGRHQTKQNKNNSKIRFRSGEGCVGTAYAFASITQKEINKFDPKRPNNYFDQSESSLKLPIKKTKALNEFACSFLCCPLKYPNTDIVFAVLSIDCIIKGQLKKLDIVKIQQILLGFTSSLIN